MSVRPQPAHWFEAVAPQESSHRALEALASTGSVELESGNYPQRALALDRIDKALEPFRQLSNQYLPYWPRPNTVNHPQAGSIDAVLTQALQHLQDWRGEAEAHINRLRELETQCRELEYWQRTWARLQAAGIEPAQTQQAGSVVDTLYCRVSSQQELDLFNPFLSLAEPDEQGYEVFVVVPVELRHDLQQRVLAQQGQCLTLPDFLRQEGVGGDEIRQQLNQVMSEIGQLRTTLETLSTRYQLAWAIGELQRLDWFVSHVQQLPVSEHFAWIRGWTSCDKPEQLTQVLEQAGIPGLVDFPPPPPGVAQPLLLKHRAWIVPFEMFARALGTPGKDEADPSPLLAGIVPLLFGYMFGDVGQGLVLVAAGMMLQKRWPLARILVLCGFSATLFGFAFGSVFTLEHLLPNYLPHPLQQPLLILVIPLIVGGILLAAGILLSAVQTYWGSASKRAVCGDLGFLLTYLAVLLSLLQSAALYLLPLGIVLYMFGEATPTHVMTSLAAALGRLLEALLQILMNTLSFMRVGAFALAHAGLSLAVMALVESSSSMLAKTLILLLGNLVIIVVEGLIVSVQTTRLVLFEFFVRFVKGSGRPFRPLPLPPSVEQKRS